jgi:hypothetical protein
MSAPDFLIEGGDFCSWHLASYPHGATVPPTPMGLVLFDQLREIAALPSQRSRRSTPCRMHRTPLTLYGMQRSSS